MTIKSALTLLSILLLGTSISGCFFSPSPGSGARADEGYRSATPIISSLGHFRANRGTYPDALDELVPDYLQTDRMLTASIKDGARPFDYRRLDSEYELTFSYPRSGSNTCRYRPSTDWRCAGP